MLNENHISLITNAFEAYAHSLRILLEAVWKSKELILIDAHEASGNIDQALTQVLNAFHSVYDASKSINDINFDWYRTSETATILSLRNARHHNIANRIRGLYTLHLERNNPEIPHEYIYANYTPTADGGRTFDTPISWSDIYLMLTMENGPNLRKHVKDGISEYLDSENLNEIPKKYNVNISDVFINATPLIVNASIKFIPAIKKYVRPRSLEGKTFLTNFETTLETDTHKHIINKIQIFFPR